MAHNYLVTAQSATVVSKSHTGYFNSPDELNTILVKGNNLEIYTVTASDGFSKVNELPFYGRIIDSLMFRPPKCDTDHLLLLTQSFSFCIIATDTATNQIVTKASGHLHEEHATIKTASRSLLTMDASQQIVVMHIYKGELVYILLDEYGRLRPHSSAEKIIIHELELLAMTFLHDKYSNAASLKHDDTSAALASISTTTSTSSTTDDMNAEPESTANDNDQTATTKSIKSKLSKLHPSKMNEKLKNLRKRNKNMSASAMDEDGGGDGEEEEKKQSGTSSEHRNRASVKAYRPLLCVLYQDYRKGRHLKTYVLDTRLLELQSGPWDTLMVEEGCNKLIAVPPPLYGVLFIGQYSVAYRYGDNCQRVQVPDGDLCCFDAVQPQRPKINIHGGDDDADEEQTMDMATTEENKATFVDGARWLIGDGLNRTLNMLVLKHTESFTVKQLEFNALGEIVSPSTVSYICSGLAFVGSCAGDSQFIEIHSDKEWRKQREQAEQEEDDDDDDDDIAMNAAADASAADVDAAGGDHGNGETTSSEHGYVEVLEEYTNLGPIVDMVAVDLERQGQCQLVTCSGIGMDGSLRVIKKGVGIEEVAEIEMDGIQGLWGVKENSTSAFDKYLVTAFISETRVLAMTDEGLEEMEMSGLNALHRTLHAGNVCDDHFVQICESEVNVLDLVAFQRRSQWTCGSEQGLQANIKINSCATNETHILCALSGGNLVLLRTQNGELELVHRRSLQNEIACVALSVCGQFAAVGLWKEYSIQIVSLRTFATVHAVPLNTDIVPRSVCMTTFAPTSAASSTSSNPALSYLFVGMGDGSLIEATLQLDADRGAFHVLKQKKLPLGTQPVRLIPFRCNGISYIFGGCDRPTVIYMLNQRLFYANVNLPGIHYMAEFNAADFSDCLAMSCRGNLLIGQMDNVQKLHISKIALREQPRRIAYNASCACYLLASQTTTNRSLSSSRQRRQTTSSSSSRTAHKSNNYFHPAYNQTMYKLTLRDEQNLGDVLYTKLLDPYWNITKIITHRFKCDPHVTYFVITSCLVRPHEKSSNKGKVQVAMVVNGGGRGKNANANGGGDGDVENAGSGGHATQLKIVHTKLFRGDPNCVRGIGDDFLLVGVRSKIQLFRWMLRTSASHSAAADDDDNDGVTSSKRIDDDDDDDYPFELHHLYTIHNNTYVLDIKVHGDFFIVVDLMKSMSMFLLQCNRASPSHHNPKLRMIDGTVMQEDDDQSKPQQHKKITAAATHFQQGQSAMITEVARDYDPSWMKCGDLYNDQYLVGVDSFCNFFILKRNIDSLNEDERGRLEVVCRVHWGDDVNVMSHGSLVMDIPYDLETTTTTKSERKTAAAAAVVQRNMDKAEMDTDDASNNNNDDEDEAKQATTTTTTRSQHHQHSVSALKPSDLRKCVFGTIDGAVGVLISVPRQRYSVLENLQRSLRKFVQGLGGLDHAEWRKFKNQMEGKAAVGFLDGDLIETYLNLTLEQQQKVADDMKIVNTDTLTKIVEEMNRLH